MREVVELQYLFYDFSLCAKALHSNELMKVSIN